MGIGAKGAYLKNRKDRINSLGAMAKTNFETGSRIITGSGFKNLNSNLKFQI